jgi:hypothetical protein
MMDNASFATYMLPKLLECRDLLAALSKHNSDRNVLALVETQGLFDAAVNGALRLLRKLPKDKGLDLILASFGGNIDSASTIASLCRGRFGSFRVIVPFMAKSAATLLVLAADERLLTCSAQLGPVDPQVRHPERRGVWFPAHSIKEALDQVENTLDPLVKLSMAEKLDPFLIGSYKDAMAASAQYVEEVIQAWNVQNKGEIVSVFTDKFKSHGHPIDRSVLDSFSIPYTLLEEPIESIVFTIHEMCNDILDDDDGIVILTKNEYHVSIEDFKITESFSSISTSGSTNTTTASMPSAC